MHNHHYFRGTMTDGTKLSTNIFDFTGNLTVNEEFLIAPRNSRWYETPFNEIRFANPNDVWKEEYIYLTKPMAYTKLSVQDYAIKLKKAIRAYYLDVLIEDQKYICFHSGGFDSRIMSLTLMSIRNEGGDHLTKNIHFRCHQPEEPMFLEIMQRQGWDKSQYSVYEGPSEDYYNIGDISIPLNGWQHYNQQMDFWSDIAVNEKEWICMPGLGGELFKYLYLNPHVYSQRVENTNLNLLIDHYPHEGQWEGYWRSRFKELMMPFYGYKYLEVSLQARADMCSFDGESDNVRKALVETFIGSHGVDCLNIEYGKHDYSWNISNKRKKDMVDGFYASMFYKDYKHLIKEPLDFFSTKWEHWYYDSFLWGFMTCYDKIMK